MEFDLVSRCEIARLLGLSPGTIKVYQRKNWLEGVHFIRINSRVTRFNLQLIEDWLHNIVESKHPGPVQQVVLVESAIDALSYRVLHQAQEKMLYLSTDGAGYVPLEQLKTIPKVVIAFDKDQTGEAMAQRLMQDLPQASRRCPTQKDWNEDLQAHFQQLQKRLEARLFKQQTQQQKKQRGSGLEL